MKTGQASKLFGVDNKTITDWVDRFAEFFSAGAIGAGRIQRDYQPEDLFILNTIRSCRATNLDWAEIHAKLTARDLDLNMPAQYSAIEGNQAIAVYTELSTLRAQVEYERGEKERLRQDLRDKDAAHQNIIQAKDDTIAALNREVGKLEAKLEMLQEKGE